MTTLDIAYFPHIFDMILLFAEFDALLRLRLTCRAVRDRVNDEWYHLQWRLPYFGFARAYSKRGSVSPASSALRLTRVLDVSGEFEVGCGSSLTPSFLRPEIIRFLSLGEHGSTRFAKTLILLRKQDLPLLAWAVHSPPKGDNNRQNVIFRLPLDGEDSPEAAYITEIPWRADVYVLLSGCKRIAGPVERLCLALMRPHLNGWRRDGAVRFYLVDVPSWFDYSGDLHADEGHERLDHILGDKRTADEYLLTCARMEGMEVLPGTGGLPSSHDFKLLEQVHFITGEEMRARVGDRAYDLTFAPQDIWAH